MPVTVQVTRVVPETTIIMVTPELPRSSSLAGTTWRFVIDYIDSISTGSDVREFSNDGTWGYPNHSTNQIYGWKHSGDIVHIYRNSKYSTEIGTVSGDSISGTGSTVEGEKWA